MALAKQDKLEVPTEPALEVQSSIAPSLSGASLDIALNATAISDSEIGCERRNLVAKKNQSNLFLIKSHSFIDHASAQHSAERHRSSELIERVDVSVLLLAQNERDNLNNKSKAKSKKNRLKSRNVNHNQPAQDPAVDDVKEVQQVLQQRIPSVILEQEVSSAPTTSRAVSSPSPPKIIKRDSFLRHSIQSIRRSFSSKKKYADSSAASTSSSISSNSGEIRLNGDAGLEENSGSHLYIKDSTKKENTHKIDLIDVGLKSEKSNNSDCDTKSSAFNVCTYADTHSNSFMAPLLVDGSGHTETQSASCLDTIDNNSSPASNQQQQQQNQHKRQYSQQTSLSGSATGSSEYSSANSSDSKSNKHSSAPLFATNSLVSIRSISPSRKSFNLNSSTTAKNEQSSSSAAAASAAATTVEKEKKRKEVSSSRVKKFQRHFSQVSKDEKLINYFSCALVSDILLQGHLYITDKHFAFYSNVFGYVTKVVIPTSSVTKISKEKTAKIIPNAVGVATADERHVFGSFISREAAFRLMCSVCPPLVPTELLSKMPADILEYSEELSIEDDSSCSISGNESPPQPAGAEGQSLLRRNIAGSSLNIGSSEKKEKLLRHSDIPKNAKSSSSTSLAQHHGASVRASAPPASHSNNNNSSNNSRNSNSNNIGSGSPNITNSTNNNNTKTPSSSSSITTNNNNSITMSSLTSLLTTPTTGAAASSATNLTMIIAGTASSTSASSTPSPSSVSSTTSMPTTVLNSPPKPPKPPKTVVQVAATSFKALSKNALLKLKFPKELHVVYLGVMLSIILALFTGFLLYRISNIEAKISLYRSPVVNYGSVNDDDIFADALRWQKELQTKSTEEAQNILNTNLQQIAKVRRSLETLSMLIHDRSSAATIATNAAEAFDRDDSD